MAIKFILCVFLYVFYQHKQQIKSDQELSCVPRIVYLYVDLCPLIVVYESNCIIIWTDFFLWKLVFIHSSTILFPENVHMKWYIPSLPNNILLAFYTSLILIQLYSVLSRTIKADVYDRSLLHASKWFTSRSLYKFTFCRVMHILFVALMK